MRRRMAQPSTVLCEDERSLHGPRGAHSGMCHEADGREHLRRHQGERFQLAVAAHRRHQRSGHNAAHLSGHHRECHGEDGVGFNNGAGLVPCSRKRCIHDGAVVHFWRQQAQRQLGGSTPFHGLADLQFHRVGLCGFS